MMDAFDIAVNYVLTREGGLSVNPNDRGGITKYGISLRFLKSLSSAKSYGVFGEIDDDSIVDLRMDQAIDIYKSEFWLKANYDAIKNQNNINFIFDMHVNSGLSPAIKCVQRACWAVMRQKDIIRDDGILGEQTIAMINKCGADLLPAMRSERAGFYRIIAERDITQRANMTGWLRRAYGE